MLQASADAGSRTVVAAIALGKSVDDSAGASNSEDRPGGDDGRRGRTGATALGDGAVDTLDGGGDVTRARSLRPTDVNDRKSESGLLLLLLLAARTLPPLVARRAIA